MEAGIRVRRLLQNSSKGNAGLHLGGSHGNDAKCSDCAFILTAGPVGFVDRSEGDLKVFGRINRWDGIAISRDGEDGGWISKEFSAKQAEFGARGSGCK